MTKDIRDWLAVVGLAEHAEAFIENGVDAALLPELSNEDLKDLGVARLADRKRLLKAIEQLSETDELDETPPPVTTMAEGERRQVTVLFADIAGYTKLSSELGAEQTHALLNRYFDTVDSIIELYGGSVDKHIGDNVMAVFGAPTAHDDDALRAVRASLEIHEKMAALSRDIGRPLQAHIGIASGQVVASSTGSATHHEYTVTGDSVNLASRLQNRAKPGQTLMSDALRRVVAADVDCDLIGEVTVKGIEAAVRAWDLKELRAAEHLAGRAIFVGRDVELSQFSGAIEACKAGGKGQAIVVRGEAGIGKTRLVEEFTGLALAQDFKVHKGLVLNFGVGKGQDAIRSVVRSFLSITTANASASATEAVEDAISRGLIRREQRAFLNDLLDLAQSLEDRAIYDAMDNATRNEGMRTVVADLLRHASGDTPMIIVVEDVHWASTLVLEHLASMTTAVGNCPAIIVMTTRVEGDPLNHAWRSSTGGCPLMTIDLGPLRSEDALSLAGTFIDATNEFATVCIRRSGGNPLFLEQLLRHAEEQGGEDVPASIQSLVLSRIDRLSPDDKLAVQVASVIGQRFSLDTLRHLTKCPHLTCDGLIDRHLVTREGDDYLFAHALIQEGIYASLLTSHRATLHRDAAEWFGRHDPVLRAQHLDRANDPSTAKAYLDAAKDQATGLHFDSALRLTERGIELAIDPDVKCDLMCLRGDALRNTGATEDSISLFQSAVQTAADDPRRCRAWIGMAGGLRVADRQEPALVALENAEKIAVRNKLSSERSQVHYLRGNVYFPLGNIDGCLAEHEQALTFAREVGSAEGEALALGGLGDAYYLRGHMRTACEQFRACVNVCRKNGFGRIEVANSHMVGWARIHLMEFAEALDDALASIKVAVEVSHHRAEALGLALAGRLELLFGRYLEARNHVERGLDLSRTISAGNFEMVALMRLAQINAVEGKLSEARELACQALEVGRKIGMKFSGPQALVIWAELTKDPDQRKAALEEAESILDTGCVSHNHMFFADGAIDLALKHKEWDEAERYANRLEAVTREQPLPWSNFMIARGRALVAWGKGRRDPGLQALLKELRSTSERLGIMSAIPALENALNAG